MIRRLLSSAIIVSVTGLGLLNPTSAQTAQLPEEMPLWTEAGFPNPIHWKEICRLAERCSAEPAEAASAERVEAFHRLFSSHTTPERIGS